MEQRIILGSVESVAITVDGRAESMPARIDTGAERSSIDLALADKLQLQLEDKTKLIRSAQGRSRRPMAFVEISIANQRLKSKFTLSDRSRMKYKVLIGHDILKQGNFLIDPLKV